LSTRCFGEVMESEMFQKRENRESPGSCISKCHLRLDFVIWSRESAVLAAPFVKPTRGTSLAPSIETRWRKHRVMALSQSSKVK
jgi:hypothetical protein